MTVDRNNIEEYFSRYRDNVFAVAFNYFKNPCEADDCVQETFIKLLKCDVNFESEEHIRNWIIRVAINECKRVTLSSWFRKKESIEDYAEKLSFTDPEESSLFYAVMSLPSKYRQVVHLYYYEDYSVKEIAEILGRSETAITTQLSRARKILKSTLSEAWENE